MVGYYSVPQWLNVLLNEKFFEPCFVHDNPCGKRAEKNIFCFDCSSSVCPKCVFHHRKHLLLQVRRYVYHDVLKLVDAERLMDCSGVQSYITNSAKVVFLRQRPFTRLFKNPGNSCFTCNRNLQHPFIFCSLSCKVHHIVSTQGSLKINISNHQMLAFSDLDDNELQLTPNSVLDSPGSFPIFSGSTVTSELRTEIVRKKRSNLFPSRGPNRSVICPEPVGPTLNRRKGVPNRSPLC